MRATHAINNIYKLISFLELIVKYEWWVTLRKIRLQILIAIPSFGRSHNGTCCCAANWIYNTESSYAAAVCSHVKYVHTSLPRFLPPNVLWNEAMLFCSPILFY